MRCYGDLPDGHGFETPCPHCGGKIYLLGKELTTDHPLLGDKLELTSSHVHVDQSLRARIRPAQPNGSSWLFEDEKQLDKQLRRHVASTPPRCLRGLISRKAKLPIPAEGDVPTFAISCPCGSDIGVILGHPIRDVLGHDSDDLLSPLAWRCCKCTKRHEFFDTDIHGYHAACGIPRGHAKGTGRRKMWSCPNCRNSSVKVVLGFSFWDYEIFFNAVDDAEQEPELLEVFNHPEDFFNDILTFACCPRCRAKTRFTNFGKL